MNTNVQVLLSSYNGEKFIKEQIDSILHQSGVTVSLLIRDDGSTDGTRDILAEYDANYSNIKVIYGVNLGVIDSFFALIEDADADYISLADQDDVWLPDKLQRAICQLEQRKQGNKPLLYCSSCQLVDVNLKPLPSAIRYEEVRTEFGNALVENMCTGCTCVFNRGILNLLKGKKPSFTIMHDFWLYLIATCFGEVVYDRESRILYRQHGGNELGAASTLWGNYWRRIKNFRRHRGQLSHQAKELIGLYGSVIPKDKKEMACLLISARKKIGARREILKNQLIFRQRKSDDYIMKTLLFCGLI